MKKRSLIIAISVCAILFIGIGITRVFQSEKKTAHGVSETVKSQINADEIINKIIAKETIPQSYIEYKSAMTSNGKTLDAVMKVWHNPSQKQLRREITDESGKVITLIEGKQKTFYREGEKRAYIAENIPVDTDQGMMMVDYDPTKETEQNQLVTTIKRRRDNYNIDYLGEEKLLGRNTYHISATAKADASRTINVWVDIEANILIKVIMAGKDKSIMMQATYIDLKPVFNKNTFKLNLPKGVEIVKQ